ncbi:MAG: competence/damage-inducible protein A [Bacteroidales bacterium]|nr:competence/damage-inducible protein A [Bacteroidales bacterium]
MNVSIINIGDELLIGQVVNTNASTMSKMLIGAGMDVVEVSIIADSAEAIINTVQRHTENYDAVLMTGGLGPTKDDITKKTLCQFFDSKMKENPMALDNVKRIFESRGYELTSINRQQAMVPECCEVLNNDLGTAPCMWFETKRHTVLVSLPGVPFEMEWLMSNRVIPKLQERFNVGNIVSKNILVQGIGESFLSDLIEPWELSLPDNAKLAYLPVAGMVKLRLTIRTKTNEVCDSTYFSNLLKGLYELAGKYIVGEDCETLAELVHNTLVSKERTLATAESCTGGTIASRLTALAGASSYFRGGVVAYSNAVKENTLGVNHETLENHGAVSEETAREMVEGVRQRLGADYAIATTGIAGPDGGTKEKPVGTIWIAVASQDKTEAQLLQFGGNKRQQNIDRSVNQAYAMLLRMIKNS